MATSTTMQGASQALRLESADPLVDMNTTPLIDVMLVLLIMIIITMPNQTHKVAMDLPGPSRTKEIRLTANDLTLSEQGVARWNGAAVSDRELAAVFVATASLDPRPEVHFAPDAAARYERVDTILALAKKANLNSIGFVGNEAYRDAF